MITCIFGGFCGQIYGRRLTLVIFAPFFAFSFVCQAVASDVSLFQLGRLLTGVVFGLISGPASVRCHYLLQQFPSKLVLFLDVRKWNFRPSVENNFWWLYRIKLPHWNLCHLYIGSFLSLAHTSMDLSYISNLVIYFRIAISGISNMACHKRYFL